MKKIVNVLCVLAVAFAAIVGVGTVAAASANDEDVADRVFYSALDEIIAEENLDARVIKIDREPVYDLSLVPLGYIYTMSYDGNEGFALVINNQGTFDLTEFYMDADNPYNGYDGEKVYVSLLRYLVHSQDGFIDTNSGELLDDEIIEYLSEKAFCATDGTVTTGTETIYYTNRSVDKYEMTYRHPAYYPVGENITNACAPAAGGNVIGFWTRYYPELAPNLTPGAYQLGIYVYSDRSKESADLVADLYYAMKTNVGKQGTSIANFKSGMDSYVKQHGRNIDMVSCMSGGSFDFSAAKLKLKDGKPLAIFVDSFRVDELTQQSNSVFVYYYMVEAAHAMAGFGYNETTYTLANGTTRTDTYIQVATGLSAQPRGYYNIYYNTTIDDCYAINIY